MKIFVLDSGLGQDISKWFAIEGNDVKHFIYEATLSADYVSTFYGKGLFEYYNIERVSSYFKEATSSNFVFVTDVNFGEIVDELEEYVPVFGANSKAEKLENERNLPQELFKDKLNFPSNYHFENPDDAIKFLNENKDKLFVIKLDRLQSSMGKVKKTYVSQTYEDALFYLQLVKESGLDVGINLQEKIDGVEVAVTGIFNGKKFLQPVFVNFEEKKAFPNKDGLGTGGLTGEAGTIMYVEYDGKFYNELLKPVEDYLAKICYHGFFDWNTIISKRDGKAYILEPTVRCFDEETEVLIKGKGWVTYDKIELGDEVLSINPQTLEIGWKKVINIFVDDYEGEMINIRGTNKEKNNGSTDILVTPDHSFLVESRGTKNKYKFVTANKIPQGSKIIRTGKWKGREIDFIIIPKYIEQHYLGKYKKTMPIEHTEKKIDAKVFCKFLGIYLAEGNIHRNGYQIIITQSPKSKHWNEMKETIENLGFSFSETKKGFVIHSVQLVDYFKKIGLAYKKCNEKFIPQEFKELSPKLLWKIIEGYLIGDGHVRKKDITMVTASKKLADDLQEIIHKCGYVANIYKRNYKGTFMKVKNKQYKRNFDLYTISIRKYKINKYIDKRCVYKKHYKGKIWDVTVQDWHTLFVRRKGKAFFSGNCGYPTIYLIYTFFDLNRKNFTDIIYDTLMGKDFEIPVFSDKIGICHRLFPYDYMCPCHDDEPFLIVGIKQFLMTYPEKYLHFESVFYDDSKKQFFGIPATGPVISITSLANSLSEARKENLEKVELIKVIPDGWYREDIGKRLYWQKEILYKFGWIDKQIYNKFV